MVAAMLAISSAVALSGISSRHTVGIVVHPGSLSVMPVSASLVLKCSIQSNSTPLSKHFPEQDNGFLGKSCKFFSIHFGHDDSPLIISKACQIIFHILGPVRLCTGRDTFRAIVFRFNVRICLSACSFVRCVFLIAVFIPAVFAKDPLQKWVVGRIPSKAFPLQDLLGYAVQCGAG